MFSKILDFTFAQKPVDFAHWFNLIAAVLLLSFNREFPKNNLSSVASFLLAIGVIAHIGLCTIDFIMWSFGNDDVSRTQLSNHLSTTPSILYPFIIIGPSMLFVGLAVHASNFIKTNPISSLMAMIGAPAIGFSFFVLKNGTYMLLSCLIFTIGLALLLYRNEIENIRNNKPQQSA